MTVFYSSLQWNRLPSTPRLCNAKAIRLVALLWIVLISEQTEALSSSSSSSSSSFSTTTNSNTTANNNTSTAYSFLSPEEIQTTLLDWAVTYPHLIEVSTSQDAFHLPTAGGASDCPFDYNVQGCLNYFAVVQDTIAHPPGSVSSHRLPTTFLSGAVHGNERVGPTAVMEATRVLLEAASCEALPRATTTTNSTAWAAEVTKAIDCRDALKQKYGMSDAQRKWLARLASTRRIVVVPTGNALGYYRDVRHEENIDPNRDFPYNGLGPTQCMQSICARTMNELFRHYLIMTSLTFHGGTELIGYEWGNFAWEGYLSPDDIAQDQLARTYSSYGGGFTADSGRYVPPYIYGDMNSIIYAVYGGFEDYAYASSWDTQHLQQCSPDTYGGYPTEKTTYDWGTLRSFNVLVEASDQKTPPVADLGTTWQVLFEDNHSPEDGTANIYQTTGRNPNGYVSRNLRLSLASIDLVQPYLGIRQINELELRDDIVPLQAWPGSTLEYCATTNSTTELTELLDAVMTTNALPVVRSTPEPNVTIAWTAGGGMEIDQTKLWISVLGGNVGAVNAPDGTEWLQQYLCGDSFDVNASSVQRLEPSSISKFFTPLEQSSQQGSGFFSVSGSMPDSGDVLAMGPLFETTLDLASLGITETTKLLVIASGRLDASWKKLPVDGIVGPANTGPQSHMVQSRTNTSWFYQNPQDYTIQGQIEWFSKPILLDIQMGSDAGAGTEHVNDRFAMPSIPATESVSPSSTASDGSLMTVAPSTLFAVQNTAKVTVAPSQSLSTVAPSYVPSTAAPSLAAKLLLQQRKVPFKTKCGSLAALNGRGGGAMQDESCTNGTRRATDNATYGGGRDRRRNLVRVKREQHEAENKRRLSKLRGQARIERP